MLYIPGYQANIEYVGDIVQPAASNYQPVKVPKPYQRPAKKVAKRPRPSVKATPRPKPAAPAPARRYRPEPAQKAASPRPQPSKPRRITPPKKAAPPPPPPKRPQTPPPSPPQPVRTAGAPPSQASNALNPFVKSPAPAAQPVVTPVSSLGPTTPYPPGKVISTKKLSQVINNSALQICQLFNIGSCFTLDKVGFVSLIF